MATSKVDMALDDIIAQNKSRRGRGGGRGGRGRGLRRGSSIRRGTSFRGRGRGRDQSRGRGASFGSNQRGGLAVRRGGGRQLRRGGFTQRRGGVSWRWGGANRGGGGAGLQSLRQRQQLAVQAHRQTARNTSMDAKRNFQDLGPMRGQRGRGGAGRGGRGRGGVGRGRRPLVRPTAIQSVRGRGRGMNRGRGGLVRGTRSTIKRGGRGGIGARSAIQRVAAASVARARRRLQTQPTVSRQSQRGRGRGRNVVQPRIEQQLATPHSNDPMQVSVISPTFQYDPVGVELSPNFASTHHTSQSLNNRFTPAGNRNAQRLILPNGRSVEYQN